MNENVFRVVYWIFQELFSPPSRMLPRIDCLWLLCFSLCPGHKNFLKLKMLKKKLKKNLISQKNKGKKKKKKKKSIRQNLTLLQNKKIKQSRQEAHHLKRGGVGAYPVSQHPIERGERLDAFSTKPGLNRGVHFHQIVKSNRKCKPIRESREKKASEWGNKSPGCHRRC